ncbi:alpha-N-acetylgalactosaminidase isoform 2-T2 [Macrochelys suwanniensis]
MKLAAFVSGLALVACALALENGLMRAPPMGWLAWERFRCNIDCKTDPDNCISEKLFVDMVDRLADDGWKELGYVYVNIDDCWMAKKRDAMGQLIPDPERFPRGIKALADYAHSRGLKLGIYGDMGTYTCGGYPGTTLDRVEQDALTFAEWGVDMLKLDGCYSSEEEQAQGYPKMAMALNATGRPIAYSCSWPAYQGGLPPKVNYTLLANICNLWRNYGDIQDSWNSILSIVDWFSANQDVLQPVSGPGHWNDPDMEKSRIEVFLRPLSHSASALVFLSRRTDMPYRYTTSLSKLNFSASALYEAQDVYSGGIISGLKAGENFTVIVNPSGVVMWYLYPTMYLDQPLDFVRQHPQGKGFHPFAL